MFHRIVAACTAALLVASLTVAVASAAGQMGVWGASISGAGLSGTASLDLPAAGWATAAFSLRHLGAGASVTASVVSGDHGCGGAARIVNLPGFTTSTSGTWSQRWVFDGASLVRLRAAVRRGSALWFDVGVDGRRDCARLTPTTTPPGGIGAEPTRVILSAPAVDEAIRQNDPSTGCPANATRGYGFSIRFAWKVFPADDVSAYQLVLRHADAYSPALNVRVGASSYRWTSCNSFVSASNLLGWHWHVTALAGDGQEVARSEPRPVRFLPCALPDGGWCFAP